VIRLALATLLLAALGGTARADEGSMFEPEPVVQKGNHLIPDIDKINAPELHFTLLKHGKRNVLYVWGHIDEGDSGRFQQALDGAKPIDEVRFFSGGGALEEGLQIGRIAHKSRLTTHLLSWMQCISACNFMFMGGTIRSIDPGGEFTVHMFSSNDADRLFDDLADSPSTLDQYNEQHPKRRLTSQDIDDFRKEHDIDEKTETSTVLKLLIADEHVKAIQQDSAQTAAEIARFLVEMSLSLRFLTNFANIPNVAPRTLTRDELRDYNVVNSE
jgi:hypothetical protein